LLIAELLIAEVKRTAETGKAPNSAISL